MESGTGGKAFAHAGVGEVVSFFVLKRNLKQSENNLKKLRQNQEFSGVSSVAVRKK